MSRPKLIASDASGGGFSLYAPRTPIHTRPVSGQYQNLRLALGACLLGGYFVLPWLNWNGRQAVLFELEARQFHVLGVTFWPQDFWLLGWVLIIAAFGLFVSTTAIGRAWCGFVCPQTVWTAMFMWIEQRIEGSRHRRMRLDAGPRSLAWLRGRVTTHAVWLVLAFVTGLTFVGYFTPMRELAVGLVTANVSLVALGWTLLFTGTTWFGAGWLREQLCFYMCPYARFQSAMYDRDTLVVAYDATRGEPRKGAADGAVSDGGADHGVDHGVDSDTDGGDCIDCYMCVQVCPTGIDIRDGLQYECIGCARCVDACDGVMDRVGKPRSLVGYSTTRRAAGGAVRVWRPTLVGYGVALTVMVSALGAALVLRIPFELDVLRLRASLYQVSADGLVRNDYELRIANKGQQAALFTLRLDAAAGAQLELRQPLEVLAGEVLSVPASVVATAASLGGRPAMDLTVRLCRADDPGRCTAETTRFLGPA